MSGPFLLREILLYIEPRCTNPFVSLLWSIAQTWSVMTNTREASDAVRLAT